jgi:hypothetical protein
MNERIKQLAKEAGYYLYDLTETHECKTVETDSKDEWITLEKFAELIVRECTSKCEFVAAMAEITNTGEMARKTKATADSCARMIKEHFGVEE